MLEQKSAFPYRRALFISTSKLSSYRGAELVPIHDDAAIGGVGADPAGKRSIKMVHSVSNAPYN
jgi:hypothetical protein